MSTMSTRLLRRAAAAAAAGAVVATSATLVAAAPAQAGVSVRSAAAAALASTTTTLTTTRNPTYSAQAGAVTARVKGNSTLGVPTGWVDFYVDGAYWWTELLDSTGRAKLAYSNIEVGTHTISATYSGDVNYDVSTSTDLSQTVLSTAPTAALTYTPASVAPGGTSRLVLSATNNTPVNIPSLGMGLMLPGGSTIVSMPPGVGCRKAYPNLFYCLTSARPGVTRKIVIDVVAPASPTVITTSGYARNIDTMEETGATATLTVG